MVLFFAMSVDFNHPFLPLIGKTCRRFDADEFLRFEGTTFTYQAAERLVLCYIPRIAASKYTVTPLGTG
jgi:hypothetical protein